MSVMARTHDMRRFTAGTALALFLLGNNFCLVTVAPMLSASPVSGASLQHAAVVHPCCAAAAARARRGHESARESTAPCCVAMAPVVTPASHSIAAAPIAVTLLPLLASTTTEAADFARAVSVEAVPPPERSATPDAGRAPPRL